MTRAGDTRSVRELVCVECGPASPASPSAAGRARLTYDDKVVVYCPECDEREQFGQ